MNLPPATVIGRLKDSLCVADPTANFVILLLAVLDESSHEASLVNAGHGSALSRRADGEIVEVGADGRGLALGVFPDRTYQERKTPMESGS